MQTSISLYQLAPWFNLLLKELPPFTPTDKAPVVKNTRNRIKWSEEDTLDYQELVGNNLSELRDRWLLPSSRNCISLLQKLTSDFLNFAAISTNQSVALASARTQKQAKMPKIIIKSMHILKRRLQSYKKNLEIEIIRRLLLL